MASDSVALPFTREIEVTGDLSYVTVATSLMRSAAMLVLTEGALGIVMPPGIEPPGNPVPGMPVVGAPVVGAPVVGALTVVRDPISGKFLKSSSELTGVPTSTEMLPLPSSIVPAGITKPLA